MCLFRPEKGTTVEELFPREYTDNERGEFKIWIYGPVTKEQLELSRENDIFEFRYWCVNINGQKVHSLVFETPLAGWGSYGRWDCVNGWTTTIEDARKRFPNGAHGTCDMRTVNMIEKGMEMKEACYGKAEEPTVNQLRKEHGFYVGGAAGTCLASPPVQTSAQEILESINLLREKARDIRLMVHEKLETVTREPVPSTALEKLNHKMMPPLFSELRENIRSIDDELESIRDCIHRVDI